MNRAWVKKWGAERPSWTLNLISCFELSLTVLVMLIMMPGAGVFARALGVAQEKILLGAGLLVAAAVLIDGVAWSAAVGVALAHHGRRVGRVLASALWAPLLAAVAAGLIVLGQGVLALLKIEAAGSLDFWLVWAALTAAVSLGRLIGWATAAAIAKWHLKD